jgi:hypothetical protein
MLRKCIRESPESPQRFTVLMLDEAQDMSLDYYVFVRHLLRANPTAQLIVVGDELQAINEYRGARPEFLTEAPRLYTTLLPERATPGAPGAPDESAITVTESASLERPWAVCRLSVSHRLTPATAAFVNTHLYRAPILVGGNTRDADKRPIYATARGLHNTVKALAEAAREAIDAYGPGGVFILAPSVQNLKTGKSPLAQLVRRHLAGVPTFVANSDGEQSIDANIILGKLAIMSYNAAKGCERPCVIVVGLDETYFKYFDQKWDRADAVPNILSVAATRASAQLIVVAEANYTLRTADLALLPHGVDVRGPPPARHVGEVAQLPQKPRSIAVSALLRHQHPETVRMALSYVISLQMRPAAETTIRYDKRVKFGELYEDVSFIYGIVAPILAEIARTGATSYGESLESPTVVESADKIRPDQDAITAKEFAAYPPLFWEQVTEAASADCVQRTLVDWCRLAVARHAMREGRHHIARQITNYDWVDAAVLYAARDVVVSALAGLEGTFESQLPEVTISGKTITGRADFVSFNSDSSITVWEFKFGELCEEHVLQLACYLALNGGGEGLLLSLATQELRCVSVAAQDARALLSVLLGKARAEAADIFTLIADFDSGIDQPDPAPDALEPNEDQPGEWGVEDVY